jgi:hypothetical protein
MRFSIPDIQIQTRAYEANKIQQLIPTPQEHCAGSATPMLKMLGSVASVSKHLIIEGQKYCAGEAQTIVLQLLQTLASLRGGYRQN